MKKKNLLKKTVLFLVSTATSGFLHLPPALAMDDTPPQQIGFHYSGAIPSTSSGFVSTNFPIPSAGEPLTYEATRSRGWQASYSYQFNKWTGAEVGYGQFQYTQNYSTDLGTSSVESDMRQGTADFVFHVPEVLSRIHPYGIVGVGALRFMPTDNMNNAADAVTQTRSSFIYGGGADIDISRNIGIRAAYRGFKFKAPDYAVPELTTNMQTHLGEPTIGVYFRFSGFFSGKSKSDTGN